MPEEISQSMESTSSEAISAAATIGESVEPGEGQDLTSVSDSSESSSAAAVIAGSNNPINAESSESGESESVEEVDLETLSDDDYAHAVLPDVEGEEVDRSLITPMAKELREAGIQPSVMAKIGEIYRKTVRAQLEKDDQERAARMKEMANACLKEVSEEEKADFLAAYKDHISQNAELKYLVDHTELGSNPAFIKLIALAGATLRVENSMPASAIAGSNHTNLERAVFEQTVPKHLR